MQYHQTVPYYLGDRGSVPMLQQQGGDDDDGSKTLLQATLLQQAHITTISHWQRDNYERRIGSLVSNEEGSGGSSSSSITAIMSSNSRRKQGSVENQGELLSVAEVD